MRNHKQMKLSKEQSDAIAHLLKFTKPIQTLGGYAGTGKTTIIKELVKSLSNYAVCAYTGKAANVLRRKGVKADTIHSTIYKPEEVVWKDKKGKWHKDVVFNLISPGEFEYSGFIVDEASMVSEEIYDDMLTFDVPMIFVGDHGQLPPVSNTSNGFNLMTKPDVTLETIHRNAGEIAHFADFVRHDNDASDWVKHENYSGKSVVLMSQGGKGCRKLHEPDQTICAFNKTRVAFNRNLRKELGYPADSPIVGDRIMCLQNIRQAGLFNGMQGTIAAINDEFLTLNTEDRLIRDIPYDPETFNAVYQSKDDNPRGVPFDYCYCVTCHKSQGDEWDTVEVLEQRCQYWEHRRWAYTASTRARKQLIWFDNER